MKIEAKIGPDGQIKRTIDFEGAELPNGRSIDEILVENDSLKNEVKKLKLEIENSSSILIKIIPNKKIRIAVEIILTIGTVIGIIQLITLIR